MRALKLAQEPALEGSDEAILRLIKLLKGFMPPELKDGKYKTLGGLLERLCEFMPLLSTQYIAKQGTIRRVRHTTQDIIETVQYICKELSNTQPNQKRIIDIMDIFRSKLDQVAHKKDSFRKIDLQKEVGLRLKDKDILVASRNTSDLAFMSNIFQPFEPKIEKCKNHTHFMEIIQNPAKFFFAIADFNLGEPQATGLSLLNQMDTLDDKIPTILYLDSKDQVGRNICKQRNYPYIHSGFKLNEVLKVIQLINIF